MSKTEEPGARFSTDDVSIEVMPISDRTSPDFINLANPVKLAGIRAYRVRDDPRHDDPRRRLAVPPSNVDPAASSHSHSDAQARRSAPVGGSRGYRHRHHGGRGADSLVGRSPHRRHLSNT